MRDSRMLMVSVSRVTRAAKRVGYSAKTAYAQGPYLLKNPEVQRIIAQKLQDADASAERVLLEAVRLATVDISGVFDEDGNVKPFAVWSQAQRAALAGCEVIKRNTAGGDEENHIVRKLKFHPKNPALELLMKHYGLLHAEPEPPVGVPCFIMPEGSKVAIK